MKVSKLAQGIAMAAVILVLLAACFAAAFFLTSFIYRNIGQQPPALAVQIINSFVGLCFAATIVLVRVRLGGENRGIFESIIKVQGKIAGGDFDARLDKETEGKGALGELVESVNNMALELGRMEKMRQEFISNVSHEIQSPLTSISGFAQALRNDKLILGDRLHYLDIIEAESIRLSRLSDNLLRLASLEAETVSFEPKPYRLDKQLRSIVLACEPQWADKRINMELFLEEISITADEDMLSQVWINLVHNSIKFTPEGGSVRIELKRNGDKAEFSISDTGIGIAEEAQEHVFERFYKADKARERSNKGSGLGLAIAKRIIDMHCGAINVRSKLGEGASFTVSLPVR